MALEVNDLVSKDIAREVHAHGMKINLSKTKGMQSEGYIDVTVVTRDGRISHTKKQTPMVISEIDKAVISARQACKKSIDKSEGVTHIVLQLSEGVLRQDELEHVWLPEQLKYLFDINLIIGTCQIGHKPLQLQMLVAKGSLPCFTDLIKYSDVNLLALMKGHMKELASNKATHIDDWDGAKLLMESKAYSEWPSILVESLLYSLFDCIKGIDLVHAKINCDSTEVERLLNVA